MGKVDHPDYYNSHPSGVECIDIIRHYNCDVAMAIKYLWRAGLKKEEGMTEKEKEIEDCKKAIWYIQDHIKQLEKSGSESEDQVQQIDVVPIQNKCKTCPKFDHIERLCTSRYCIKYNSTYYTEEDSYGG